MKKNKVAVSEYQHKLDLAKKLARELSRAGKGRIGVGADIKIFPFRHRLTGVPSFDYITNGGLLEANFTELWAPKKSTKTTLAGTIARNIQMQGGMVALSCVEPFDKGWWRNIGVFVEYGEEDFEAFDVKEKELALRYNHYWKDNSIIPLTVMQSPRSDELLEQIVGLTSSNLYDLIILDSIGEIRSTRLIEEKKLSEESEYGGETKLLGRFCGYMRSAMNRFYTRNDEGDLEVDPNGDIPNKTCFIGLNQARVTMNTRAMAQENKFHPTGGEALAHEWAQSIFLQRLDVDLSKVKVEDKEKHEVDALAVRLKGTKIKGGPEGREAVYKLHIKNHTDQHGIGYTAGEIECFSSLKSMCITYNLIQREGRRYIIQDYNGMTFHSTDEIDYAIKTDAELYGWLYHNLIITARNSANTDRVPTV